MQRRKNFEWLALRTAERIFILQVHRVAWFEAAGNYARAYTPNGVSLVRKSIGQLDLLLDPKVFVRVNRSVIVNIANVRELQPLFHREFQMTLTSGETVKLTRRYRRNLEQVVAALF